MTALGRDIRHGLRIGRAELVRSVRGYATSWRRLVGLAVAVLFFGGNLVFVLPTAYLLGRGARSLDALPLFGVAATALPVALLLLSTFRTLERIGSIDAEELVLTAVHPRAVVVGLLLAEVGRLVLWFGLPLGALLVAFALGLGAPTLLLSSAVVLLPLVAWAAVWGHAAGLGALRALRRLPAVRRLLRAGGVVAMLAIVVASQFVGRYLVETDDVVGGLRSTLAFGPLADYLALAVVGTPLARPVSVGGVAVLVALALLLPVGLAVATRQAAELWFADVASGRPSRTAATSSGGFAPPWPFGRSPSGRVAWAVLLRGVRRPQELAHLVMVVFFVGPVGTTVVQSSGDALGPLLAGVGVGLGSYLAGATFGLNPLGDDRPQLPVLLLAGPDPRTLVRGRVIAGLAVGIPVAVLVPLASVPLGTALRDAVAFATLGVAFPLAAAAFAVGVGASYPIYEERNFWGTETVVPSTLVMIGFLLVVGGGTALGLVAAWYALTGHLVVTAAFGVAAVVYLLLTAGASYGSYRYAVRRYRRYTLR